jgi:cytochrome c oxidase subunit 2
MRRSPALFSVLFVAAPLLTACGDDDTPVESSADTTSTTDSDAGGHGGGHEESSDVADDAREIEVSATSFAFDPDEITVTAGENVAIVLTSDDLLHDFTIDDLDAHVAADRGETETGGFRADEPGEYTFYCSVEGHREAGMEGTLIVEDA